ncbi:MULTISPECIES: GNAT family N-acetyltransferase [Basfia]|uniref:N-acetyltransferase domain-containing protein n=1 Tax=Mannheimia succiniciproducens (strain KCTC 0769BP / MBEL55E) TaxID=221988 RepID=Q65VP6_MANSM|nr:MULTISPECIES: GNAT family N-acetyltransferase [Basfia]AAU36964.1 unknown [[Mannheimia] succiniciproducens MBEL55E]SEQ03066.1 hypothetical protein SAMN02910415_00813 [Basfia succiniciproducens]
MKIQHTEDQQQGEFFILSETGEKVAKLTYFYQSPRVINANHTYVSDSLRGQGIADKLYQALIQLIKEKRLELIPSCSYIAKKWRRDHQKS